MFGKKASALGGEMDVGGVSALAGAREFLRMWSQPRGHAICLIDPAALGPDPALFGLAMVDALRHGAKAWAQAVQIDEEHAFARIMEGFNAELGNPTDTPRQLPTGETH